MSGRRKKRQGKPFFYYNKGISPDVHGMKKKEQHLFLAGMSLGQTPVFQKDIYKRRRMCYTRYIRRIFTYGSENDLSRRKHALKHIKTA